METTSTKVYKLTVMVVDHDDVGPDDAKALIECSRHMHASVVDVEEREVEWHDGHPLNSTKHHAEAFKELFGKEQGK